MTKFRREVGERIYLARDNAGMSQQALADLAGLDQSTISGWECGKFGIQLEKLIKLAHVLGVSVGWLVGEVRG